MITRKPFYYIRHGQTDWNAEKRFQGKIDIPLNAVGEQQARDAIASLMNCGITHIFSSPLKRARRTADIINCALKLPITEIDTLQEVNFGVMEGTLRTSDCFSDKWKAGFTPDEAETYIDFTNRVFGAVQQVLNHDGLPLIVAHGGVFWPIHEFTAIDLQGTLPNARAIHVHPAGDAEGHWGYSQK